MYTGVSIQPHWSNQRDLLVQTSQNLFSFFCSDDLNGAPAAGGDQASPLAPCRTLRRPVQPRPGSCKGHCSPEGPPPGVSGASSLAVGLGSGLHGPRHTRAGGPRTANGESPRQSERERERERDYSPLLHRRLSTASQAVLFLSSVHATQDQDW